MKTQQTTIDITPSWQGCVRIFCAVLRNPEASQEALNTAESELMRLAEHVDSLQSK
jgi:hypothetical protein